MWDLVNCTASSATRPPGPEVRLVRADPFYPSSKTCSACGWVKAKLTLAERTFTCEAWGCGSTAT